MTDQTTNVAQLKDRVRAFCEERDWDQYHGPKDLAIGIITEASELLEHFRFRDDTHSMERVANPDTRREIESELADVLFFVLRFAQRNDIDLTSAFEAKLAKNAERYPAEKSRGKNLKYTEL